MILFLKLETSGLISRDKALDHPEQPFIAAMAAELTDTDLNTLDAAMLSCDRSS